MIGRHDPLERPLRCQDWTRIAHVLRHYGIKQGLIDLITGKQPGSSGLSAGRLGILLAVLTVVTAALQVRRLLWLRLWAAQTKDTPS